MMKFSRCAYRPCFAKQRLFSTLNMENVKFNGPLYTFLDKYDHTFNIGSNRTNQFATNADIQKNMHSDDPFGFRVVGKPDVFNFMDDYTQIAYVFLPGRTNVYIKDDKCYINDGELSEIIDIQDMPEWKDPEFCLEAVTQNASLFKHVKRQTLQLCIIAHDKNNKVWDDIDLEYHILMRMRGYYWRSTLFNVFFWTTSAYGAYKLTTNT